MNTFKLEIITPDKRYPPREVLSVDVPAEKGRLTVLARHQPFICSLTAGTVKIGIRDAGPETGDFEPRHTQAVGKEEWTIGPGTMSVAREAVTLLVKYAESGLSSRQVKL